MNTLPNPSSDNMQSQNDTLLRQLIMLRYIPQHPRTITARELTERVKAEGFVVSKRTVERDLLSLSEIFPIFAEEQSRPYEWSWLKDAKAFSLPGMSPLQALTLELAHEHLCEIFLLVYSPMSGISKSGSPPVLISRLFRQF